ncbi:hypothetical protein MMC18_005564 [Xylographa bjoerkii]|nr:hypothetical protein [Xylographa bjoerkii]
MNEPLNHPLMDESFNDPLMEESFDAGLLRDLANAIAAGGDVIPILERMLEDITEEWPLYSTDGVSYNEMRESIEQLVQSNDRSIFKLLAATYMNKYLEWVWHPFNQIPGNEDALRVYESHIATLHQLGYR